MVRQVDPTIVTVNRRRVWLEARNAKQQSLQKQVKKRAPDVKEEPAPIRRIRRGKTGKRELSEELPSAKRREVPEARVIDYEMEDEAEDEGSAW
eukprot:14689896-Heterocapsa_arctica.AAC.1